ncbi:hypothetical protein J6590_012544 [Homalodisca vitripennis]|nr:hypothetical protein J6590_012544 [Homalodisca vitripennis]
MVGLFIRDPATPGLNAISVDLTANTICGRPQKTPSCPPPPRPRDSFPDVLSPPRFVAVFTFNSPPPPPPPHHATGVESERPECSYYFASSINNGQSRQSNYALCGSSRRFPAESSPRVTWSLGNMIARESNFHVDAAAIAPICITFAICDADKRRIIIGERHLGSGIEDRGHCSRGGDPLLSESEDVTPSCPLEEIFQSVRDR